MRPCSKTASALVLFSGGQDSATCLFWAKRKFKEIMALGFHYNQRHKAELECAKEIAKIANVPFTVLELPLLGDITCNALTRTEMTVDKVQPIESPPNTMVDGRNQLFLTYAAIYAKSRNIANLVTGVSESDYSGYPDCRGVFIRAQQKALRLSMEYPFRIHTPLIGLDKAGVWRLANDLGVLEIIKNKTLTCYNGHRGDGCGECPACALRYKGYEKFLENQKKYV